MIFSIQNKLMTSPMLLEKGFHKLVLLLLFYAQFCAPSYIMGDTRCFADQCSRLEGEIANGKHSSALEIVNFLRQRKCIEPILDYYAAISFYKLGRLYKAHTECKRYLQHPYKKTNPGHRHEIQKIVQSLEQEKLKGVILFDVSPTEALIQCDRPYVNRNWPVKRNNFWKGPWAWLKPGDVNITAIANGYKYYRISKKVLGGSNEIMKIVMEKHKAKHKSPLTPLVKKLPFINSLGIHFVWIPAVPHDLSMDTETKRPTQTGFWISKKEINQKQWIEMMEYNPGENVNMLKAVNYVSWLQCYDFAERLNLQENCIGYRLPKISEYEHIFKNTNYNDSTGEPVSSVFGVIKSDRSLAEWTATYRNNSSVNQFVNSRSPFPHTRMRIFSLHKNRFRSAVNASRVSYIGFRIIRLVEE